ncbi:MAG: DNA-directed RNA polymerase subunit omega [Zetaproteobacteria bacterium]|nr:DNA-directed RNA polymerase subunit omega [Zetaproteobacteria bacterium]
MARVTVEDCVRYYPNRFEMVVLATKRARQVAEGLPILLDDIGDKPAVHALRELGEGVMSWEVLFDLEKQEKARLQAQTEES